MIKLWPVVRAVALSAFAASGYLIMGVSIEMTFKFAIIFAVCFLFLGWAMSDKRGRC